MASVIDLGAPIGAVAGGGKERRASTDVGARYKKKWMKYETFMWGLYVSTTLLAIIDRFTTNVWPRQTFRIGAGSAGSDRLEGFKPGPWSVVFYDVLARISGRFSICCFNFMLISKLHILEQLIANSWISRRILDCSNITNANHAAHRWNGIALVVMTLIHVWSILLPCVTHGWKAKVVPGIFEWPLSERTPPGFKDANVDTETMSLQGDDVFRMVEMTLLLGVLVPLSIRWMNRCWHLGIHVHRFITVLYFVDIVRRHSHPHSWVLNTPIFVIWLLDKMLSVGWRRYTPPILRQTISKDYMLLLWEDKPSLLEASPMSADSVGRKYQIKLKKSSCLESRHPFTTFMNRSGTLDFMQCDDEALSGEFKWTSGLIIRVFHAKRKPHIGGVNEIYSHSRRLALEDLPQTVSVWGPFQGSMNALITKSVLGSSSFQGGQNRNLVLAGSGSAINFIIDLLSLMSTTSNDINAKVLCLYTTRDPELFQWVMRIIPMIAKNFNKAEGKNVRVVLAFTGGKVVPTPQLGQGVDFTSHTVILSASLSTVDLSVDDTFVDNPSSDSDSSKDGVVSQGGDIIDGNYDHTENGYNMNGFPIPIRIKSGRINFDETIPCDSDVFCQGSYGFQHIVEKACSKKDSVKIFLE